MKIKKLTLLVSSLFLLLNLVSSCSAPKKKIVIDKVDKELNETMKVLKKYFPNIDIELTHGIDKEDYVFLLKLKGIEK